MNQKSRPRYCDEGHEMILAASVTLDTRELNGSTSEVSIVMTGNADVREISEVDEMLGDNPTEIDTGWMAAGPPRQARQRTTTRMTAEISGYPSDIAATTKALKAYGCEVEKLDWTDPEGGPTQWIMASVDTELSVGDFGRRMLELVKGSSIVVLEFGPASIAPIPEPRSSRRKVRKPRPHPFY